MKLTIKRTHLGQTSTVSDLLVDGEKICVILEDKVRDLNKDGDNEDAGEGKIYGQTAIPYGKYKIVLEPHGSIHEQYKKKDWAKLGFPGFEKIYKGMLMVTGIKGFSRVHIHIGNKIADTLGCPLTGSNAILNKDPYTVTASTQAYVRLYKKVIDQLVKDGYLDLEVI